MTKREFFLKIEKSKEQTNDGSSKDKNNWNKALDMSVSQVFAKDGKKYAFVSFSDGKRQAEGKIPDCIITSNQGFDAAETKLLEHYMKENLPQLKKMASSVRVMNAFMHD